MLGALAYWGYSADAGATTRLALAIGVPVLAAVVWGLYAAPKAKVGLPLWGQLAVKALVFGAAVAALFAAGQRALAAVFAVLIVVNTTLATLYPGQ